MLEGISLLLSVIAVLALVGISIYFYMDVDKHKTANVKDFNVVNTNITNEKNDRLGNLAYVIDQVNVINKDIKGTFDSTNSNLGSRINSVESSFGSLLSSNSNLDVQTTNLGNRINNVESGFGSLLSIRNGETTIPISSLASISQPNIDLMKNISVLGSMTIKDVQSSKPFKICSGTGATEKCLQFPNAEGDMYFTGIGTTGGIVMDALVNYKAGSKYINPSGQIVFDPLATAVYDQSISFKNNTNEIGKIYTKTNYLNNKNLLAVSGNDYVSIQSDFKTDLIGKNNLEIRSQNELYISGRDIIIDGNIYKMVNGQKVLVTLPSSVNNDNNNVNNDNDNNNDNVNNDNDNNNVSGGGEGMSGCPYTPNANYYCADGSISAGKTFKIENGKRREYESYATTIGDDTLKQTLTDCTRLNELCPSGEIIPA